MRFAPLLAVVLVACRTSSVGLDDVDVPEATPVAPDKDPAEQRVLGIIGESPWQGRLLSTRHHYSNGCTDHRELTIAALAVGGVKMPVITAFAKPAEHWRGEPRFLQPTLFGPSCVKVHGALVAYAHEGISGSPAWGLRADRIEPARCPD